MELKDFIENKIEGIFVIHSSTTDFRNASRLIPDSMDDVWKLLKMYAASYHQTHLNNTYLVIINRNLTHRDVAYIRIESLDQDIRDKKINKLLCQ